MKPLPPPDFPDPCLPGTNLHCSMNYTFLPMEAQYGWKFLRTPYQKSWEEACVGSAPFCGTMVDLAILRVWTAYGLGFGRPYPSGQLVTYHKAR